MAVKCWEQRGCDDEMMGRCPHNVPGEACPTECHFAACTLPTHVMFSDVSLLLDPHRDTEAAKKEICRMCEHFLKHGPDIQDRPQDYVRHGNPNRFIL